MAWVGAGDLPNMEKAKGIHVPYWAKKGCPVVHMEPQHMFAERLSKELTIVATSGDITASGVAGGGASSGGGTRGGGGGDTAAGEPQTWQSWDRGGGKWMDNGKKKIRQGGSINASYSSMRWSKRTILIKRWSSLLSSTATQAWLRQGTRAVDINESGAMSDDAIVYNVR